MKIEKRPLGNIWCQAPLTNELIGEKLDISLSTKQRGQQLERLVAYQLGYRKMQDMLDSGYPDIRNQMLEVKVQDSPTIDLGKYSPQFEEKITSDFTTRTIRYLITLTDAMYGNIDGIILCPGEELGKILHMFRTRVISVREAFR